MNYEVIMFDHFFADSRKVSTAINAATRSIACEQIESEMDWMDQWNICGSPYQLPACRGFQIRQRVPGTPHSENARWQAGSVMGYFDDGRLDRVVVRDFGGVAVALSPCFENGKLVYRTKECGRIVTIYEALRLSKQRAA